MQYLVRFFCAFDIEIRAGNLERKDLRNRKHLSMLTMMAQQRSNDATPQPALVKADSKYPEVDLEDGLLSDDILISMFVDGQYDRKLIHECLDRSRFFITPEVSPAWQIVINFDSLDDDTVNEARRKMDLQFDNREVTETGEILHIFGLRLMLASNSISGESLIEATISCKQYVSDLVAAGRLPPRGPEWRWTDPFEHGYEGHAYWVPKGAEKNFEEIWSHLINAHERALQNSYPDLGAKLLQKLVSDGQAVFDFIAPSSTNPPSYGSIPFLAAVNPQEFADAWLKLRHDHWRKVEYALRDRFENGRLDRELTEEREWAEALGKELLKRASDAGGLAGLRIRRAIPDILLNGIR